MHAFYPILSFFFVAIAVLLVIVTLFLRGEKAVYFVIITWFIYPNWATHITGLCNIPLFAFLQVLQSIALLLIILRDKLLGVHFNGSSSEFKLIIAAFLMVVSASYSSQSSKFAIFFFSVF